MPPVDPLRGALFLIVAMIIAGLLHSAWLRSSLSRPLQIPLDGGRTFRGRRIFGDNKTVRGFVVIVPGAALSFAAVAAGASLAAGEVPAGLWRLSIGEYAALGAWAGLGFMLGELPNSFIKRQLDIAPGAAPGAPAAMLASFVFDRVDSILGMLIAVSVVVPTPPGIWGWVLVLGPAIHWSFSVLLFWLGVKARPA
jgi:hypothetical protein